MMEMWKWNLAFQCIVNIGVRGSEPVRTRVVEADMVPVIATILDNYFQVIEKCRDTESRRKCPFGSKGFSRSSNRNDAYDSRSSRHRRHAPPPISIPEPTERPEVDEPPSEITPTAPAANLSLSSPPERTTFPRQHQHHRSHGGRSQFSSPSPAPGTHRQNQDPPMSALPLQSNATHGFGIRPVRDVDRLPSMLPNLHAELSSQPQSPTTPSAPMQRPASPRASASDSRPRRRPSIRHQLSVSGSDDDGIIEEATSDDSNGNGQPEPVVGIQTDIVMQDIVDEESLLEPRTDPMTIAVPDVSNPDEQAIRITHQTRQDGSLVNSATTPTPGQVMFPQNTMPPSVNAVNATPPNMHQTPAWYPTRGLSSDRPAPASILAAMPRDEDVLMSLQLLAYVSKYCYLRTYFQQSHLVPRLKIGNDLRLLDPDYNPATHPGPTQEELDEEWDNEFVKKPGEKPYNIFPLIEKFTAKSSSSRHNHSHNPPSPQQGDMQYWAGVVMRNLCRKDESRGGIRQCAYWRCGKWEEYTRQFAKCRRCRRTKYCSKECQKGAWGSHRFWCVAAEPGDGEQGSSEGRHGHHGSHRSHRSGSHHQHSQH